MHRGGRRVGAGSGSGSGSGPGKKGPSSWALTTTCLALALALANDDTVSGWKNRVERENSEGLFFVFSEGPRGLGVTSVCVAV